MNRESKFKKFIKNPGKWLWAFYGGLVADVGAIIATAVLWNAANPVIYVLYALLLALVIYCAIFTVKYIRAFAVRQIHSHKFTQRMSQDFGFRTMVLSGISFIINVAYVVFQMVMAIIYHSMWYATFAAYYAMLSLVRGVAVWGNIRADRRFKEDAAALRKSKLYAYLWCGILLILLSEALTTALGYMIANDISFRYAGLTIYVMVTYAFYKIITSVVNLVRAKRFNDYGVQSLRNIKVTEALVSIFAMQTALIATFGGGDDGSLRPMNVAVAIIVCLFTLGLGIYMIVRAAVVLRRDRRVVVNAEEENADG